MLKNYLKVTFRNVSKNIVYVLINVTGLGLALAVCIVAHLSYKFDSDFDSFHENKDRIFRIEHSRLIQGSPEFFAQTPCPLGPAVDNSIEGIESTVRIATDLIENIQLFKVGEHEAYGRLIYADPDFFNLFTFPLISGSKMAFQEKNTIFISEQTAKGLFGDQDPIGKIIFVWNSPYTIGGVFKNHPLNSSFHFDAVAPIQNWFKNNQVDEFNWNRFLESTFILAKDPKQAPVIEKLLQQSVPVINAARKDQQQIEHLYLAPFLDLSDRGREVKPDKFRKSLHPALVRPPFIAAICILLIACFNFTNITIAMAGQRLKEIGIRKVSGGNKTQLVLQFMGENLLLSIFALIFAVFFAKFLVPSYSGMWDFMHLSFSLTSDPELWIFLILLLITAALLSGAYPAFYISGFSPVHIFRDKLKLGGNNIFAKIILTIQFAISVLALTTGVTFLQNANFQKEFDSGFDGKHLYEVWIDSPYMDVYKNAILGYSEIESMSEPISSPFFNDRSIKYGETEREAVIAFLGMDTYNTMGLRLVEGRSFEAQTEKTDEKSAILVNRKFVKEFGMKEPVGEIVRMNDTLPLVIIGVIENILDEGVWTSKVSPTFYRLSGEVNESSGLLIRTAPENRQQLILSLEKEWNKLIPDLPFLGVEWDIYMEAAKGTNKNVLYISIFLVLIATLISAAGLYSQVSLSIIRRTKEMGIRKIHGASIPTIIKALNREFLVILGISSLIGIVAATYANKALLDIIWEYYTELSILTFILPLILIFAISLITVCGKVYLAANRNPLHSLRYE